MQYMLQCCRCGWAMLHTTAEKPLASQVSRGGGSQCQGKPLTRPPPAPAVRCHGDQAGFYFPPLRPAEPRLRSLQHCGMFYCNIMSAVAVEKVEVESTLELQQRRGGRCLLCITALDTLV